MLELLYKRRSIRKFTAEPVSSNEIKNLIEALLLSPSSRNKRPWRFIAVTNPEIIQKTAGAKPHGLKALETAPLAIAVIGMTDVSDVWVEDCSIASIIVQLEAESLGLGSCWLQMRKRFTSEGESSGDYLSRLYGLAGNETVEAVIAVGHPAEELPPYTREDLDFDKIEYLQ